MALNELASGVLIFNINLLFVDVEIVAVSKTN